jgi:hypothetical protein
MPEQDSIPAGAILDAWSNDPWTNGLQIDHREDIEKLAIRTSNSLYEITIIEGRSGEILLWGGQIFPELTPARLTGATLAGSFCKMCGNYVGFRMEINANGQRIITTIFTEEMQERLTSNDWLKKWTHAEVDAGADIVVMHGTPLLHEIEIYHGRPIFYDLGNSIYNLTSTLTYIDEPINWESAVAYVQFQGKKLQSISFRPIALNNVGEGQPDIHNPYTNNQFLDTRGLPSPVTGARAGYILQRLADASKPFGTTVQLKGDTAEIKLNARN